jgi:DNA-binding NtrC family response regulator
VPIDAALTILVYAESSDVRDLLSLMLEMPWGHMLEAGSEAEAVAVARTTPIDLFICEIVPPDFAGPKIAEQIHELQPGTSVLFISDWYFVPGFPNIDDARLLRKPFSRRALNETVATILARRPSS